MIAEEYIANHLHKTNKCSDEHLYITEDDALEAINMAKRDIAQRIHELICNGTTIAFIDKYVTDI